MTFDPSGPSKFARMQNPCCHRDPYHDEYDASPFGLRRANFELDDGFSVPCKWVDSYCLLAAHVHVAVVGVASKAVPRRSSSRSTSSRSTLASSPSPGMRLLRPLLTSRSGLRRRPFRRQARSHQVRAHSFAAQPPNLRRPIFGHNSFAVSCLLALIGNALYLVLVHRLAVSLDASSPRSVALPQLRFTSLAVVSLRRDFHPQECAHAGRTQKRLATSVASL